MKDKKFETFEELISYFLDELDTQWSCSKERKHIEELNEQECEVVICKILDQAQECEIKITEMRESLELTEMMQLYKKLKIILRISTKLKNEVEVFKKGENICLVSFDEEEWAVFRSIIYA